MSVCLMNKTHSYPIRIYYEDTDAGGIVYYANHLKFTERARTEFLRELGFQNSTFIEKNNLFIVVRSLCADYLKPAYLDDSLTISTMVLKVSPARFELSQNILRDDDILFKMTVELAAVSKAGIPQRLPAALKTVLEKFV